MTSFLPKLKGHISQWIPRNGFHFDRPIVLLQSDDWGRVGLRDRAGLEQLLAAGLKLGEHPYDLYSLETAEDLAALIAVLNRHRDATGRTACIGMNFITANLDFARMKAESYKQIRLLPLSEGLPGNWHRPGLLQAYREGIAAKLFYPALHGTTHFCPVAVGRSIADQGERGSQLRTLWEAGTPYIHWRMPWIGYEHWDPEEGSGSFLPAAAQRELTGRAVGLFAKLISTLPRSACAPGYRANHHTHRVWAQFGIRVAQNGPGTFTPPHFDGEGILHLHRTVEFEPAVNSDFSVETCLRQAGECFERGIPAIVSVHSINFHSSVRDFRSRTLELLDSFLAALRANRPDLLFVHDEDLFSLVNHGFYETEQGSVRVNVTQKKFRKAQVDVARKAE
jgi:hypothetical protein